MPPAHPGSFFCEFMKRPGEIGTVIPSSRYLESRIVRLGNVEQASLVVELGPGTGGTTRALLSAMDPTARLLAIDVNEDFVSLLQRICDPRLISHHGRAEDLEYALDDYGFLRPDVIVCGIPFSAISRGDGRKILRAVWSALAPGGRFVAYQMRGHLEQIGRSVFGVPHVEWELRNVPPLRVYRWEKPVTSPSLNVETHCAAALTEATSARDLVAAARTLRERV